MAHYGVLCYGGKCSLSRFMWNMPGGRPTKYDPSMCEDARAFLAEGLSKEALAGQLGISKQTLYRWMSEKQEFSDAIEDGEAAGQLVWERLGLDAARGMVPGFASTPWAMNMKNRFGWRDKVDHEHTGRDGQAIETKVIQVVGVDADTRSEEA